MSLERNSRDVHEQGGAAGAGTPGAWVGRGPRETPIPGDGDTASYQLGERLGDGSGAGQSHVYESYHPRFAERFVIKLFPKAAGGRAEAIKAFARESGRVSILRHPHIVQILDSGVLVDRTPFVAMEKLVGETLEERLNRGALPLPELMPVLRGMVSALSGTHAAGIFHRELRPDNVFLASHADGGVGVAKVLDFGVSQLTWAGNEGAGDGEEHTAAGRYLAPEQVHGGVAAADARTDEFALAALTYRMLSGVDAFPATVNVNTLDSWVEHTPRPVIPSVRGVSPVDAVLYRGMSQHPDERYPSVATFFRAFEEALASSEPTREPSRLRRVFSRANPRQRATTAGASAMSPVQSFAARASTVRRTTVAPGATPRQIDPVRTLTGPPAVGDAGARGPRQQLTLRQKLNSAGEAPRPASLTQQFFDRGEELERTKWKSAIPGRDTLAPGPVEFTSFNRVPRQRKPLLVVVGLILLVGGGLYVRKMGPGTPSPSALWANSRIGRTVYMFRAGLPWRALTKSHGVGEGALPTATVTPMPAPAVALAAASDEPSIMIPPATGSPSESESARSTESAPVAVTAPALSGAIAAAQTGPTFDDGRASAPATAPSAATVPADTDAVVEGAAVAEVPTSRTGEAAASASVTPSTVQLERAKARRAARAARRRAAAAAVDAAAQSVTPVEQTGDAATSSPALAPGSSAAPPSVGEVLAPPAFKAQEPKAQEP